MQYFYGNINQWTGIATIFMLFFVSHNLIRRVGWKAGALFTPIMLFSTGILFLSFIIFREELSGYIFAMGTSPIALAVMFGGLQNIFSKSSKYSLFDPTKEMAYIPLDQESKVKGKAAIDVVGARLGKSGGSLTHILLGMFLPNVAIMTPYIGVVFIAVSCSWLFAVFSLSKRYEALTESIDNEKEQPSTNEHSAAMDKAGDIASEKRAALTT